MFLKNNLINNYPKIHNILKNKKIKKKILYCNNLSSYLFEKNIIFLGLPISEKVSELVLIELILLTFLQKTQTLSILINSNNENFHYYPYQYSYTNLITCIDYINRNFNEINTNVVGKSFGSSIYFLTTLDNNVRSSFQNSIFSIESVPYYFNNKNEFNYRKNLIETKKILNNLYYLSTKYTKPDFVEKDINIIGPTDALRLGILDTILN
mmetsp:Transcript_36649/g.71048  ORF Transcript_36649/g.71048 Transcript_36649/m.71048 type:complete len:210 (-) Transcript_36649:382-1011(-)